MPSTSTTVIADTERTTADRPPGSPAVVLIADKFDSAGIETLARLNCRIEHQPNLSPETLPAAVGELDPDMLIVRSTKVLNPVFDVAKNLSLVIRAGAGIDNIDVVGASKRGIFVANCPGRNAIAVAELVWGLILSCDRRIPDQVVDLRDGRWNKAEYAVARGLAGRTLGVVGLGRIGTEVAKRGRAFSMNVVGWSRSLTQNRADELGVGYCSSLINLAKMSDVISINIAATDETKHLINDAFFDAMREGAYLINTSRGSVIDDRSIRDAIEKKNIRVGLDVYSNQPGATTGDFADEIVNIPGVYGTHHVGASTAQAQKAISAEVARIIERYLTDGVVYNCINRAAATPATTLLTVRHLNKPGVLAHVFYTLGQAGINVEEMENMIYEGADAACARIQLDDAPDSGDLDAIRSNEHVLSVTLTQIPSTITNT